MTRVAAVVLAAGPSRRYREAGGGLKQLAPFGGEPLVRRTTRAALASGASPVLVVVGCEARAVSDEVAGLDVEVVVNDAFADGQSTSVRAGLSHLEDRAGAALFLPCDQPLLGAREIDSILEAYESSRAGIVVPIAAGVRRAPVLFDRSLFDELAAITGDSGGRQLFDAHAERIHEVAFEDDLALLDIDTPADRERLTARLESRLR